MKELVTSNISGSVKMPIKKGTLTHIQSAYTEPLIELAKSIIGENYNSSDAFVLSGLVNTGSGSNYIISSGMVLLNGALYAVSGTSLTLSGGNVVLLTLTTSYTTATDADPVEHSNGSSYNVHKDTRLVISQGTSGSGTVNYSSLVFAPSGVSVTLTANYTSVVAPKVKKAVNGLITFEGECSCGAGAAEGDTITTLGVGYRPAVVVHNYVPIFSASLGGSYCLASITVNTNGTVVLDDYYDIGGAGLSGKKISFATLAPYYRA